MSDTILAMLDKDPLLRPNETELDEVFATLVDYARCRENQIRVAQKSGIGRVPRIEGMEETPEAEETVADMLKTAHLSVSSSFLEKRLSKMPLFNRRGGKKLSSQIVEVGNLIDALRSLTSMQLKIVVLSIMVIVVTVFACILGYYVFYENDEPPPIAVAPVTSIKMMCKKCSMVGESQDKNIEGAKCPRCGGAYVPAVKCRRCSNVFSLPDIKNVGQMTIEEYEKATEKVHKCPSCGSSDFYTPARRAKR
jgi:Zn finger protein HypA/HybF involved in hydrogenase expression